MSAGAARYRAVRDVVLSQATAARTIAVEEVGALPYQARMESRDLHSRCTSDAFKLLPRSAMVSLRL